MLTRPITSGLSALISLVFGLATLGLVVRFFFRLFGANPASDIAQFVYNSTSPLLAPFRGIFDAYTIQPGYVLEFSTLLAIAFYLLIAWLLTEFIEYISYNSRTYRTVRTSTITE